jgi:membrane fusion protein, heavy metal efflux system
MVMVTTALKKALNALPVCLLTAALLLGCNRDGDKDADGDHDKKPGAAATQKAGEGSAKQEIKLTPELIARYGITIAPAHKQVLTETFSGPARITFDQNAMAQVTSIVPGRVIKLAAQLGDRVKRGQELAVIESTELGAAESDFLEKRIAAAGAQATVDPLKRASERAGALYRQTQGISLAEVQKRAAEFSTAQAAARTAEAAAVAARNRLQLFGLDAKAIDALAAGGKISPNHSITALIDGQIVQRDAVIGQVITPERDTLFTVADLSALWVLAEVPVAHLGNIKTGAAARVHDGGKSVAGKIILVSPTVDASTQTFQVRIEVANSAPPTSLMPGTFATVDLFESDVKTKEPVLAVPEAAVQTINGQSVVFVADDDEPNTFLPRIVAVAPTIGTWAPIISGLKENESVVTSGSFILKAQLGAAGTGDSD